MALIRRAEDIMELDPPLVPIAWENILDVWYNYVKGHNPKDYFGILRRGEVRYVLAGQDLTEHLCKELDSRHETVDLLVSRVTDGGQAEGLWFLRNSAIGVMGSRLGSAAGRGSGRRGGGNEIRAGRTGRVRRAQSDDRGPFLRFEFVQSRHSIVEMARDAVASGDLLVYWHVF